MPTFLAENGSQLQEHVGTFREWVRANQKYAPMLFFVSGFGWDSLTLGRIDMLLDRVILASYLIGASVCIYMFNVADDGKWKGTILEKVEEYFPLAIQFFFGGLCSAFVVYFFRSVSFSKSIIFFLVLVGMLVGNEFLDKRISNKYLQFSSYFLVNFTFFTFFIPVMVSMMNTLVFLLSGLVSLATTVGLIVFIYKISPSTRKEINERKMLGIILGIYLAINTFYFLNMIPPVPLALENGVVAHSVEKVDGNYEVTYEQSPWYNFWQDNRRKYVHTPGEPMYVFTSIFAPSNLTKKVSHTWLWYSPNTEEWEKIDDINFEVIGGRDEGFRGFTYKSNVMAGKWKVEVVTEEGLVLGIIPFTVVQDSAAVPERMTTKVF